MGANPEWRDRFDEISGFVDSGDTPGRTGRAARPGAAMTARIGFARRKNEL
jgi:hypothetical protein